MLRSPAVCISSRTATSRLNPWLTGYTRCSSWAHWKVRSGLPISDNWTSVARCYGWGATSEYPFKIGNFAPTWASWPKISGRRDRPHQPFFSENQAKWSFVSYKNPDISFFRFVTIHAFDRQTDRRTDTFLIAITGIPCSAEKDRNRC